MKKSLMLILGILLIIAAIILFFLTPFIPDELLAGLAGMGLLLGAISRG